MRIGWRILLGTLALVAVAALLLGQVFLAQVKPGVRQTTEDTLVDAANLLAELASDDLRNGRMADGAFAAAVAAYAKRDPVATIWGFPKRSTSLRVYVADARGIVLFDSTGRDTGADYSRWNDVARTLRGEYGARSSVPDPADPEATVMHVAAPVRDARGGIVGVLTVAKPNAVIAPFIARSRATILAWGLVLLAVALLAGGGLAAWIARQLGALRRYAQAAAAGERAALPRTAGEFAELGEALATMRAQLEGKQYVERYVQDLTHEMKGPLAAIRAGAELLEQPLPPADQARFAGAVLAQSERLAQMIDRMLALAALEHRQQLDAPVAIDVATLVNQVAFDQQARLATKSQRLAVDVRNAPRVRGDAFLLRQAIGNLVENAAAFAPVGGDIDVTACVDGGNVSIVVGDRGPGVPDFALARVFERFYSLPRPDGGSRSSGLGLNFVAEVAGLHGGSAALANRDGGGAIATLLVPLADA